MKIFPKQQPKSNGHFSTDSPRPRVVHEASGSAANWSSRGPSRRRHNWNPPVTGTESKVNTKHRWTLLKTAKSMRATAILMGSPQCQCHRCWVLLISFGPAGSKGIDHQVKAPPIRFSCPLFGKKKIGPSTTNSSEIRHKSGSSHPGVAWRLTSFIHRGLSTEHQPWSPNK